ncbi:MAG: SAM-dependent DNA methyltransferase [Gammaproteobacteria bacterium]|nr:SAM-dependent DNA methyltransferase [Gammaproteobacteria bacterium]MCY4297276.1 SAM-dependent DNA methyltransferase [Gammaproteobacteria bacterium]
MKPLDRTLRNRLERAVREARDVAEAGARAVLEELGVGRSAPSSHLSEPDRDLRRRLRAHGRQLGDHRKPNGEQATARLVEKIAYEHWHRMLFARFLAENNLLMYPDPDDPVPVTLEECEDLAEDEAAANGWELAARFAARMLPQIFRLDSPVLELALPPERQQALKRLVAELPPATFTATDSLGWVYQYWQAKQKDEVNASEVKIGAAELPAVTQLFTEPYMVSFLLDNSLGAWWAARRLSETDRQTATSEEELRQKAAIPNVPLEYLRFVTPPSPASEEGHGKDEAKEQAWAPAAGTFDNWPEQLADLKTLDPCCGSGHFLVAAFLMLVPMRMELEGLSAAAAVDAVLRENLHGLELDPRCVELAAFALALAAWTYPGAGGYRALPELNIACSGLSISVAKDEWKRLAMDRHNLRIAMDWMHDSFKDAPVLGSLLNPATSEAARLVRWDELSTTLEQALKQEQSHDEQEAEQEAAVVAQGIAKAANLLAGRYHWVITNVPYLARGKQHNRLRDFCAKHHPTAKNDLATAFLDRCLDFATPPSPNGRGAGGEGQPGGTVSVVLPQNWLFLTRYRKFREKLLKNDTWHLIARLGPGAFETISGEVVKAILISLSRGSAIAPGLLCSPPSPSLTPSPPTPLPKREGNNLIHGLDVSEPRTAAEKAGQLQMAEIRSVQQAAQLENPDARVMLDEASVGEILELHAVYNNGICTGDDPCFRRTFWEFQKVSVDWTVMQSTVKRDQHFGGSSDLLLWENGKGFLHAYVKERLNGSVSAWLRGLDAWNGFGVTIKCMSDLPAEIYLGQAFDSNVVTITPKKSSFQPILWTYMSSPQYKREVRKLNQKLNVGDDTFIKVPFDLDHWTKVAEELYPNGLPKPYTNDATQWIFHGHPCGSVIWDETIKWTAHGSLRTDDTVLQVAVARLLGYRWPAEHDAKMDLADEQREWVNRCNDLASHADEDGIVCIPPLRGEAAAHDRLLNLLIAAYGDTWSGDVLAQLLQSADHAGKTLETWLRDKFFTQHCKLFHHRPFIWHIWDGLRDGFAALVNYHKLDAKLLEILTHTYLGDWINRQKQDIANRIDGAQERLAAAESLKKSLELIREGEPPCDIFVRWKPIEEQPIGWNPDLNDGIRLNIRPFLRAPDIRKKNAGILRDKPNIHWNKDRGKDVQSAPWYQKHQGNRINDHNLTLAEKHTAREKSHAK